MTAHDVAAAPPPTSARPRTARDWLAVAKEVKTAVSEHNLSLVAAGVAFYALLAMFPAMIAMVTVYALVADADQVSRQLGPLLATLPGDARDLVDAQLKEMVNANDGGLTIGLVASLAGALWAAAGGMQALMTGLNIIYDVPEGRNFLKLRGLALGLTFGALIVVVVALGLVAAFPVVLDAIGLDPVAALGAQAARWIGLAVLIGLGLSVLYRWGPDRRDAKWRALTVGTACALAVWILGSVGFSVYVSNFGSYSKTYGALAAVVVLLMWLFLSAFAVLLGAQTDAVLQRRRGAFGDKRGG